MTRHSRLICLLAIVAGSVVTADEPFIQAAVLKVPQGFTIELVAGPPLVERPVTAAFDEEGRLYVADSSGSNDPVAKQLEERPHRILRLADSDGDGKFDTSAVFADRMMFPSGTLFHAGSLYVSAPPSIWKLTDTDGDGVADQRVEWFQGKTLTGCANDLHGPYLGPDGWIYWCKGAFAEQTHTIDGKNWKTRAAHIFRCRPDGTGLETVMTGGMDNPIDVVFTPEGERIFTSTFVVHPGNGQRDGLIHAMYGGVYGKDHGALEGHPRTGELMPVLTHLGPAAPSGLERYESSVFGDEYSDNLFACQFNLRKVSRHVLRPAGSSFATEDSDFVTSDSLDFHPTDVLEDADGSLLVVDTGGWYKLCCPTSQLEKPDILGGIYRIRRVDAKRPADPRGKQVAWSTLDVTQLWSLMADVRPAVCRRATYEFAMRRDSTAMRQFLANLPDHDILVERSNEPEAASRVNPPRALPSAALRRAWALVQVDTQESRPVVRRLLKHADEQVRHVALQAASLHRDAQAAPQLIDMLRRDSAANRRVAAEALGRTRERMAVPHLLSAASSDDRALQHSIIFALIELADATATQAGLDNAAPGTVQAALIALDQMPGGGLKPAQVVPLLSSSHHDLRQSASWLVARHPEWGSDLAKWFATQLAALPNKAEAADSNREPLLLETLLLRFAADASIQDLLATSATQADLSPAARRLTLRAMAQAKLDKPSVTWSDALAQIIVDADPTLLPLAVEAALGIQKRASRSAKLNQALSGAADDEKLPILVRVQALTAIVSDLANVSAARFNLLIDALSEEAPLTLRSAAADALAQATLSPPQLERLCDVIRHVGPLELHRLLAPFERTADDRLGLTLLSSLKQTSVASSLQIDVVRQRLAKYGPAVQQGIDELHALVNVDIASQRQKISELLPRMAEGDVRRGQVVFNSAKATCTACHRLGYTGGHAGPDLTRIGETRSDRDLLEAILYPSLSFVRSFEPVVVVTVDGKIANGLIRTETTREIVLATGPNQESRISRDEIEEMRPGTVSIMPAGLDQQLTVQQLADLVAFLKNTKPK